MSWSFQDLKSREATSTAIQVNGWTLDDFGGKFAPSGFQNQDNPPGNVVEIYCADDGFRVVWDDDHWRADVPWDVLRAFINMCEKWLSRG